MRRSVILAIITALTGLFAVAVAEPVESVSGPALTLDISESSPGPAPIEHRLGGAEWG